jgi:hypothetical protein
LFEQKKIITANRGEENEESTSDADYEPEECSIYDDE